MMSTLMDRADRRVVDLSPLGFPEIPVLGMNRVAATREGAVQHRHRGCLEITFCLRGGAKFDCNEDIYALKPGMAFITTPNDEHRLRKNQKGAQLYWIFLREPKAGVGMLGLPPDESSELIVRLNELARCPFPADDEVPQAFGEMFAAYDDGFLPPGIRSFRLRVAALRLLSALSRGQVGTDDAGNDRLFGAIVNEMRRSPQEEYGEDWLVSRTKLSPNTILARFRKLTGLPPHAFLVKCRIHKAQDLLLRDGWTVTRIASELGFASSQHFSTRFRQETGLSPSEWTSVHKNAK